MTPKAPKDLWEQLDAVRVEVLKQVTPPPGSFTVAQYAARYQMPESTAAYQIMKLRHAGKLAIVGRQHKQAFYAPKA